MKSYCTIIAYKYLNDMRFAHDAVDMCESKMIELYWLIEVLKTELCKSESRAKQNQKNVENQIGDCCIK